METARLRTVIGDRLWRLLQSVRHFELEVTPGHGGSTRRGAGTILLELPSATSMLWRQQGHWVDGPLAGVRFTNSTRWEWDGHDALRVSHQRRGPDPVLLSTLSPGASGRWNGTTHHCGEDRYTPSIDASRSILRLSWQVTSPSDPYRWVLLARP
ncbi:MAG TPA: DUF6314 family protein [Gemmatimonadales bacterium]|nr:DUF6314 family protein [Gemmatimonadales bacterium]